MFRYYCMARPPAYANYPDRPQKPTALEVWMPARVFPGSDGRWALGWLEYENALPVETVDHWTLWPENEVERAELVFFREESSMRELYMAEEVDVLRQRLADGDFLW